MRSLGMYLITPDTNNSINTANNDAATTMKPYSGVDIQTFRLWIKLEMRMRHGDANGARERQRRGGAVTGKFEGSGRA